MIGGKGDLLRSQRGRSVSGPGFQSVRLLVAERGLATCLCALRRKRQRRHIADWLGALPSRPRDLSGRPIMPITSWPHPAPGRLRQHALFRASRGREAVNRFSARRPAYLQPSLGHYTTLSHPAPLPIDTSAGGTKTAENQRWVIRLS